MRDLPAAGSRGPSGLFPSPFEKPEEISEVPVRMGIELKCPHPPLHSEATRGQFACMTPQAPLIKFVEVFVGVSQVNKARDSLV